jgi:uncharacterized membrane protein
VGGQRRVQRDLTIRRAVVAFDGRTYVRATQLFTIVFAGLFVASGVNHFRSSSFYVAIVPGYLPRPLILVYLSGALEIVLGATLLVRRYKRLAAWGLVALLIAVFPANVQMALHPELYGSWSPLLLWARLPLQILLVAWAWSYTRRAPLAHARDDGGVKPPN